MDGEVHVIFRRERTVMAAVVLILIGFATVAAKAEDTAATPSCTLVNDTYQCSWLAFRSYFDHAHTVTVQTEPRDLRADAQLRKLATEMGKVVVEPSSDDHPDLQFLLIPLNKTGAYLGPAEEDLATLRIYAGGSKSKRGQLIWAEVYRGKPDIPWPSVAYYILNQFKDRFAAK